MPTITDALIEYMKKHEYTSLCNPELDCGCGIDDLAPCGEPDINYCEFGYTKECNPDECLGDCEYKADMRKGDSCYTLEKPAG